MLVAEGLRKEQAVLRQALAQFEKMLASAGTSERAQTRCGSVVRLVKAYFQKEGETTAPYGPRIQAALRAQASYDHVDPRIVLRDLDALVAAWKLVPTETVVLHVRRLLEELREGLAEEEREFFPVIEAAEAQD